MRIFQFDECLNSKRLAAICTAGGKCTPHRFPKKFKAKSIKDSVVLHHFFSLGKPIITNDGEMLSEHVDSIPEKHPGLIVVVFSDDCHDELTDEASALILDSFKKKIPDWPEIPCDNSILILTEKSVSILHKEAGQLQSDLYQEYTQEIIASVTAALDLNLHRQG